MRRRPPNTAPRDERRDEARAAEGICEGVREHGGRDGNDLEPRLVDPPPPARHDDDACAGGAGGSAAEGAVPDLLHDEPGGGPVTHRAGLRLRDRENDEKERHADPVVEPTLDVEALANTERQPRERHHGLPERSVGRSEHDREQERLRPCQRSEENEGDAEAGNDRQRQPDAEQTSRDRDLVAERAEVDARGVAEEDDGERRLGQQLYRLAGHMRVDETEGVDADDEPDRGEHHRTRERRAGEPP